MDCTLPRVYVDDNVFEKAERAQEMYLEQDKRIIGVRACEVSLRSCLFHIHFVFWSILMLTIIFSVRGDS